MIEALIFSFAVFYTWFNLFKMSIYDLGPEHGLANSIVWGILFFLMTQ